MLTSPAQGISFPGEVLFPPDRLFWLLFLFASLYLQSSLRFLFPIRTRPTDCPLPLATVRLVLAAALPTNYPTIAGARSPPCHAAKPCLWHAPVSRHSPARLPVRAPARPFTRPPAHLSAHSPACPAARLPGCPLARLPACPFTCSPVRRLARRPACLLARSPARPLTCSPVLRLARRPVRLASGLPLKHLRPPPAAAVCFPLRRFAPWQHVPLERPPFPWQRPLVPSQQPPVPQGSRHGGVAGPVQGFPISGIGYEIGKTPSDSARGGRRAPRGNGTIAGWVADGSARI